MISGVFAESVGLSEDVKKIVGNIAEKKGIQEDIESIEEVDFGDLPQEVDVENIDDTSLAVYEVKPVGEKSFFVITASDEKITATKETTKVVSKMLLNFGSNKEMSESGFLDTATGVETSLEKGYVMMRDGSITGLSTNLEIVSGSGDIEIVIYKNGEPIGFRNTLTGDSVGIKKDYDIQSVGTVNFKAGDVISVYAKSEGDVVWKDVVTLIEIAE